VLLLFVYSTNHYTGGAVYMGAPLYNGVPFSEIVSQRVFATGYPHTATDFYTQVFYLLDGQLPASAGNYNLDITPNPSAIIAQGVGYTLVEYKFSAQYEPVGVTSVQITSPIFPYPKPGDIAGPTAYNATAVQKELFNWSLSYLGMVAGTAAGVGQFAITEVNYGPYLQKRSRKTLSPGAGDFLWDHTGAPDPALNYINHGILMASVSATRFYLTNQSLPDTLPAFAAGWEQTSAPAFRSLASERKLWTPLKDYVAVNSSAVASRDVLVAQFISRPIRAGTIDGTIKGLIRCLESAAANDMRAQVTVRVFASDLVTVRGTLIDFNAGALSNEFATGTLTNRKFPLNWSGLGQAVTTVVAQDGDHVVLEIGYRIHAATSSVSATFRFGDAANLDLAENEVDTNDYAAWIELSAGLVFLDDMGDTRKAEALTAPATRVKQYDQSSGIYAALDYPEGADSYGLVWSREQDREEILDSPADDYLRLRPSVTQSSDSGNSFPGGVGTPTYYEMKAWHTTLSEWVYWRNVSYPDFGAVSSGYSPYLLSGIVVIGVWR